jgi:hypothetical protein
VILREHVLAGRPVQEWLVRQYALSALNGLTPLQE